MDWYTIVVFFLSLIIGGLITYYYTARAKLEVEELNTILLKTGIADFGIKLLLDDIEYDKPLVVYDLQLINRGNRDISKDDIEKNIKLIVPEGYRIIKVVESKENNPDIGEVKIDEDHLININLKSIKKNENIKFQAFLVYENFKGKEDDFIAPKMKITCRIRNIGIIKYYNRPPIHRINRLVFLISTLLGLTFYLLMIFSEPFSNNIESFIKTKFLFKYIPIFGSLIIMGVPILINMVIRKFFP